MIFLLSAENTISQTLTVFDRNTGEPIYFVAISNNKLQIITYTDERGKADVEAYKGFDSIYVSLIGYESKLYSYDELQAEHFRVYLSQTDFRLDEVVIAATRWAQSRKDLTSRITSIRPFEIQMQNPQTAADLLGSTGEVYIQKSQQGGGSPMIRGFSTNRLLISVDGIRMNNAIFRSGNLHNIISIDPYSVKMVEVMFGPGSVVYGSDAIGGVMSFYLLDPEISKDGKFSVNGNAAARFASANTETTAHLHVGIKSKAWASISSITLNRFGHLKMGKFGPDEYLRTEYVEQQDGQDIVRQSDDDLLQYPTAYDQINLLQKIRFTPNTRWDFLYSLVYSNTTDFDRYDRLIQYRGDQPRSAEWYYGPQLWMMNSFSAKYKQMTLLFDEASMTAAFQLFKESRHDRNFGNSIIRHRYEQVKAYQVQFDFIKKMTVQSHLVYGLEYIFNEVDSEGKNFKNELLFSEPGPARYPQSDWTSMGAFASLQHRFSPLLLATLGIRYSHYGLNAQFDTSFYSFPFTVARLNNSAFNGSVGIVLNPNDRWTLSTNFSTGFRAPNIDDIGKVFDSEPGSVIVPNPDLKAEYARNIDLAMAHYIGNTVKVDASAYYTRLKDAMVRRPFTIGGADSLPYDGEMSRVLAIQNASQAEVYGVQAGLEIKLPFGFGLYTSLTWQKGEEELDDGSKGPLRHAAPFFGRTRLSFTTRKLRAELNGVFNNKVSFDQLPEEERNKAYLYAKDENGYPYSPAWHTINFKAVYQLTDQLNLSGGIENITDRRYRPYSSGLAGPGRNFIMSVSMSF